jgi:hypothetical protein
LHVLSHIRKLKLKSRRGGLLGTGGIVKRGKGNDDTGMMDGYSEILGVNFDKGVCLCALLLHACRGQCTVAGWTESEKVVFSPFSFGKGSDSPMIN